MRIVAKWKGDGIPRMKAIAKKLGAKGKVELKRGLIDGGRQTQTKVRKAIRQQTNLKERSVTRRVTSYVAEPLIFGIKGQGKGVTLDEVKGTRVRAIEPRHPDDQPRDDFGRYAKWPEDKRLAKGLITSAPWNTKRAFAHSYEDRRGRFVSAPPDKPKHVLYGPALWKELVKDESLKAFDEGVQTTQRIIETRLAKLMK